MRILSLLPLVSILAGCAADAVETEDDPIVAHRPLRMQYTCNFAALEMRALAPPGPPAVERVDLTFSSDCRRVANQLVATRATIARPSFIAACNRATLERFTASPTGGLHRASATPFTFTSDCTQEEQRINAPIAALPGDVARIDYTCSGNRTLEMRVVGAQGRERKEDHSYRFASDCTSIAESLRPSRTDIRRDVTLGICDGNNVFDLYAVTPLGDVSHLERRRFAFSSDCRRAMDDANR
jgi:hypothetical protein